MISRNEYQQYQRNECFHQVSRSPARTKYGARHVELQSVSRKIARGETVKEFAIGGAASQFSIFTFYARLCGLWRNAGGGKNY